MTDREKIIDELKTSLDWVAEEDDRRGSIAVKIWTVRDVLEILKKQRPVKPIKPNGCASYICGACEQSLGSVLCGNYCPWCGAEIKR